jgi:ribosomal protein S18 acetylase RimI-like enzyme
MEIRPMSASDVDRLGDIDATVEASRYLHVERTGQGLAAAWRVQERPLREKRIDPNRVDDELHFAVKQVAAGIEEGVALAVWHEGLMVGQLVARLDAPRGTLRLLDVRIDFDHRRQGLGSALLYRAIQEARERGLRAVSARTRANNFPAAALLLKAGFDLAGLDTQRESNHDLVKEAVTLFWYAVLD